MRRISRGILLVALGALICWQTRPVPAGEGADRGTRSSAPAVPATTTVDSADLDAKVEPCEDFYRYANGGWLTQHPIPEDHARWGVRSVMALHDQEVLRSI